MRTQTTPQSIERNSYLDDLGIQVTSTFIPFSQSRNKDKDQPSLNWKVTVSNGKQSMVIDYMQGIGHHPQYKQTWEKKTYDQQMNKKGCKQSCETGKQFVYMQSTDHIQPLAGKPLPQPTRDEVLYCLVMDSDVLNYGTYEEWASDLGYDEDSRKGEAIYRLCLEQSLKLKNMIGEPAIEQLRGLFQDY